MQFDLQAGLVCLSGSQISCFSGCRCSTTGSRLMTVTCIVYKLEAANKISLVTIGKDVIFISNKQCQLSLVKCTLHVVTAVTILQNAVYDNLLLAILTHSSMTVLIHVLIWACLTILARVGA